MFFKLIINHFFCLFSILTFYFILNLTLHISRTLSSVTRQPDEVSPQSQQNTVGFMVDLAKTFSNIADGSQGEAPSLKNTVSAATGIVLIMKYYQINLYYNKMCMFLCKYASIEEYMNRYI